MKFFVKNLTRIFIFFFEIFCSTESKKVAFVIKRTVPFSGNIRIVAEALLKQGSHQLVIYKNGALDADCLKWRALGVRVYECMSVQALRDVHSASVVVLGHSGRDALLRRRKPGRRVINLWHGVAIKRIEHLMPIRKRWSYKSLKRRYLMYVNSRVYDAMIASSATDRLTNALAFGLELDKVHVTGLPRFDYLAPDYVWPPPLQEDATRLDALLAGRRMVLYAPTFRESSASALKRLGSESLKEIKDFLRQRGMVLGIRPHPYDQAALGQLCDGQCILDMSPSAYVEPAVVLRAASGLVVDYSSIWVDYLLLNRPILGLMLDFDDYAKNERGFIFDWPFIFPGPIVNTWSDALIEIKDWHTSDFFRSAKYKENFANAENMFLPPENLRFHSTEVLLNRFFLAAP